MEDTTTYLINYETQPALHTPNSFGSYAYNMSKYWFKIDTKGNINIKTQNICVCSMQPNTYSTPTDELVINDNIPIPEYIIKTLKSLIENHDTNYYSCHWQCIINTIKTLKDELKIISNNPKKSDIQTLIEFYQSEKQKNKIMETNLTEANKKIKDLQTYSDNTLKKYEELKKENIKFNEYKQKIEQEKSQQSALKYKERKLEQEKKSTEIPWLRVRENEYKSSHNLSNCWSNPGGATIYTQSNAQNTMVYNEATGIYQPSDNST
jgi:hypothetical protein